MKATWENRKDRHILVAYASKYGATAEIAERIGRTLQAYGAEVSVREAGRVLDLFPYSAVVLGSAVYAGQWRRGAADFLQDNELILTEMPVWLYSSGPTGEGDPVELMGGWQFPAALQPVAGRIRPLGTAFFGGFLDPARLNLAERLIVTSLRAPLGDYRDWQAIAAWAQDIAASLGLIAPAVNLTSAG